MATYNTENQYITDCLNSILFQNGNFGIELVIVNDGSDNNNTIFLETFIKSNPICDLININKRRMIIKNKFIRLSLSPDFIRNERRLRIIKRLNIRNMVKACNSVCSSYYAYLCKYYSISDEDKYLIEFIISATY